MKCCTLISRNIKNHTRDEYFYMFKCSDTSGKITYKKYESMSLDADKVLTEANERFCLV